MAGRHRAPRPASHLGRNALLVGIATSSAAAGTALMEPSAVAAFHPASVDQAGEEISSPGLVPVSSSSAFVTYTVARGDCLSRIAAHYGLATADLYLANRAVVGGNPDLILPGQVLSVSGPTGSGPVTNSGPAHAAAFQAPLTTMAVTQAFKGDAHRGIDLHADIGTPGYAVADGTVRFSRPASGFGLWTVITSQIDGMQVDFVYGHMDHLLVAEGDHVSVGDHIIDTGTNGIQTGPHLHFEVWIGGRTSGHPVDPIGWLRAHGVSA